jgi:hypothetical protein
MTELAPVSAGHHKTRNDYDGLHGVAAQFVAVSAAIVALALPLLNSSASLWTRIGVSFALVGTVVNGLGFMIMGRMAGPKREPDATSSPETLYWRQMAFLAVSVALIGLSLVLLFIGQWGRH